ncbi:hypothetical protein MKZ38_008669 [Zalerion maritima]|uniref:Uncharacterized protein n=1 Tax=Zalerion maritima TaxID=339359 RepID=A0AAD5WMD9_9PEZI|nr:hypothetical protein MKZ38_008669 [Zalerion maritima]
MSSFVRSPGQDHDKLAAEQPFISPSMSAMDRNNSDIVDISATQKMVSAMSGSLLTSLLVTPLDVVRVRWQSQSVQTPPRPPNATDVSNAAKAAGLKPMTADLAKPAIDTANSFKPSASLGVTACCREVFFMNNNAEFCLAGPKLEGLEGVTASSLHNVECAVEQVQKKTFTSTFDGMRKIAQSDGFTALWRGLSPTLVMTIPGNIIYYAGYDWLRYNKNSPIAKATRDIYTPLVAGMVARILAVTAVSPIELFRTRMLATSGVSAAGHLVETFKGMEEMIKHQGYRSLWRGLTLTLWRDVPFSGIYWLGYETTRNKLTDMREQHQHLPLEYEGSTVQARRRFQSRENQMDTFIDSFTAGALSGAIASIVTMPFDVAKTRTQIFRNARPAANASSMAPEDRPILRLLWHIFETEGVTGLFRGWVPRTLKVAPACAIMISSYEVGKRTFRSVNMATDRMHGDGG